MYEIEAIASRSSMTQYNIPLIIFKDQMHVDILIWLWMCPYQMVIILSDWNLIKIKFSCLCCYEYLALLFLRSLREDRRMPAKLISVLHLI